VTWGARKYVFDILILPINDGHPVKRVIFATEVIHDKKESSQQK
jgi:hypothetical protein